MKVLISLGIAAATLGLAFTQTGAAAGPSCNLLVPPVRQADDGIKVAGVSGSCTFAWNSTNQVVLAPKSDQLGRWRVLGSYDRPGGPANTFVKQTGYHEDYYGCGRWRVRVLVKGVNGEQITAFGPSRTFCAE